MIRAALVQLAETIVRRNVEREEAAATKALGFVACPTEHGVAYSKGVARNLDRCRTCGAAL